MTNTTRTYTTRTGTTVPQVTRDRAYNEWMIDADFDGDLDDYIDTYFA